MVQKSSASNTKVGTRPTVAVLVAALLLGCGRPDNIEGLPVAQSAYDEGMAAEARGAYADAEASLTRAIDGRALDSDQLVEAYLHRAVCRARQSKHDEAMQDVAVIFEQAPQPERALVVRAFIHRRRGDENAAYADETAARARDPNVETIAP